MSDETSCNLIDLTEHFSSLRVINSQLKKIQAVIMPVIQTCPNIIEITETHHCDNYIDPMESCSQSCNKADYLSYQYPSQEERSKLLKMIEEILQSELHIRLHEGMESSVANCGVSLKTSNNKVLQYYTCHHSLIGDLKCFQDFLLPQAHD